MSAFERVLADALSPHPCHHCGEPFQTREERLMHALYSYNCLRRGDEA